MSRPTPPLARPLTTATVYRLLAALATGCVIVAVVSLALTGLGTPTAGVFAIVGAALLFASSTFAGIEHLAAKRAVLDAAARPQPAPAEPFRAAADLTPERVESRLNAARGHAARAVGGFVAPVLDRWLDEELHAEDVSAAAVDALVAQPHLLDWLAECALDAAECGASDVEVEPEPVAVTS